MPENFIMPAIIAVAVFFFIIVFTMSYIKAAPD